MTLPAALVRKIDAYARLRSVDRTEALELVVRAGLASELVADCFTDLAPRNRMT